jgi:hypothetical protein
MRINIEITEIKDSYDVLRKAPAARREIKLKKKKCESRARYVKHVVSNREKVL